MKKLVKTSLAALAFTMAATTYAKSTTTLKVASIAPPKTPWFTHLEKWRDNVEKASNGEIKLKLFPSGQLGNEFDVYKQVIRGRVDIGAFSGAAITANVPEFSLMSTPFLFDDAKTIDCIYDSKLNEEFKSLLADKKLHTIQWNETGWVYTYSMDDLSDPTSAKGYKIRTAPTPMSRILWESVDASGIEVPYVETPAALQTGVIKGGESSVLGFMAFGLAKIAPNFHDSRQYHQAGATVISQKKWSKISPEHQKIIMDNIPDVNAVRAQLRGMSAGLMKKYSASGGNLRDMKEGRAKWAAAVEPNWPKYVKSLGGKSEELWPKILEAKKSCEG